MYKREKEAALEDEPIINAWQTIRWQPAGRSGDAGV